MRWAQGIRLRLRGLLFRSQKRRRLKAEMQFHLDALIAENLAAGIFIGLLAAILPARSAVSIDPMRALRQNNFVVLHITCPCSP